MSSNRIGVGRRVAPGRLPGVPGYVAAVLADHPIAFWRFLETSGSTLADSAGAHALTAGGSALTLGNAPPKNMRDYSIVAAGNSLLQNASPDFQGNSNFSAEVWVKTSSATGYPTFFAVDDASQGVPSPMRAWVLRSDTSGHPQFECYPTTGSSVVDLGYAVPITDGNWHHLVVTFSAGAPAKLYVDGGLVATSGNIPALGLGTGGVCIAADRNGAGITAGVTGSLAAIAYYTYVLTAAQVSAHYNAGYDGLGSVVFDSFNRADNAASLGNADSGQPWTNPMGSAFGIQSTHAYNATNTDGSLALVDSGLTDATVSALLLTGAGGLVVRAADANNYYIVNCNAVGNVVLYKCVGGSFSNLAQYSNAIAGALTVTLTARGSNISVAVNGVTQLNVTDTAITTGTKVGLRCNPSTNSWDNFSVNP